MDSIFYIKFAIIFKSILVNFLFFFSLNYGKILRNDGNNKEDQIILIIKRILIIRRMEIFLRIRRIRIIIRIIIEDSD